MGQGSMTGRALGFCTGNNTPGFDKGFGGGMGRGFGFGRGMGGARGMGRGRYRNWPDSGYIPFFRGYSAQNSEDEIKMLKSQAEVLKRSQRDIEKRIEELENPKI
jgi:hypothetical protein